MSLSPLLLTRRAKRFLFRPILASRFDIPILLLVLGLLSFYFNHASKRSGDEYFYYEKSIQLSKYISPLLRLETVDWTALIDGIVERGWFVPGMAALLAPVHLLWGEAAPLMAVRAYLILVNLAILFLISRELRRLGTPKYLVVLGIVIPCAVPFYLFFLGMLWGDLVGVHLAILTLLYLERRILGSRPGSLLSMSGALAVGILITLAALVRPQYVFLVIVVLVRLVLQWIRDREVSLESAGRWTSLLRSMSLVLFSVVLGLAPWHYVLYERFGASFMVTSTFEAPLFQDEDFAAVAIVELGKRNRYHAVHRKLTRDAHATGRTVRQQADYEVAHLPERGMKARLDDAVTSLGAFYFWENFYLKKFLRNQLIKERYAGRFGEALVAWNRVSWYLLLAIGLLVFCWPEFPQGGNYFLPLGLNSLIFLLTVQPYLGRTHGRYYVALIPVFAISGLIALRTSPVIPLREFKSKLIHDRLVMVGQVFALCYGVATACALAYIWTYVRPGFMHLL